MRELTQAHCNHIAWKRHGFKTPRRVYDENSRPLHFEVEHKRGSEWDILNKFQLVY